MYRRRVETEIFFWTLRLVILFVLPMHVSDIGIYRGDVSRYLDLGQWPYRDFAFEYPPLTFGIFLVPSFLLELFHLVRDWDYRFFLALLILPFDYLIFRGLVRRPPIPRAAFLYAGFTALLPHLLFDRLDVVVAAGLAMPFLGKPANRTQKDIRFALAWGLSAALKLVPLLLLPFRLLAGAGGPGRWFRLSFYTCLPLLLSTLYVLYISGGGLSFIAYHQARGVQVETLLGNLMLAAKAAGFSEKPMIEYAFRAQQVAGVAGLAAAAKLLFWLSLGGAYGFLSFCVWRKRFSCLRASWLFVLSFVTFGYVLSPQYFFWLIPLGIIAAGELRGPARNHFLLGLFLLLLLTGMHFEDYWAYARGNPLNIFGLLARNVLLFSFWAMNWFWFRFRGERPIDHPPPVKFDSPAPLGQAPGRENF